MEDVNHSALSLDVRPEKLEGFEQALGLGGLGAFIVRKALDGQQISAIQAEIFDPSKVAWRDNHGSFENQRGLIVVENHTVYALKLHRGDQALVERVPRLRRLASNIESCIRDQAEAFPSLADWEADEMSLHRYDDPEVGLSFHKDNLRFVGLVAILKLEGVNDLAVLDSQGRPHSRLMREGDMALLRATGLYPAPPINGKTQNLCPDHAVLNLETDFTTSFIVRANSRPDEQVDGFEYDNWPATA